MNTNQSSFISIKDIIGEETCNLVNDWTRKGTPIKFFPVTFTDKVRGNDFVVISYGNLTHGVPCAVVFTELNISFYVEIGDELSSNTEIENNKMAILEVIQRSANWTKPKISIVKRKASDKGYQHYNSTYLKLTFSNSKLRSCCMKSLEGAGYKIYCNDKSLLHRSLWGEANLNTGDWINLVKYKRIYDDSVHKGIILEVAFSNCSNIKEEEYDELHKTRAFRSAAWDIEGHIHGMVPQPNVIEPDENGTNYDEVKLISYSLKWLNSDHIVDYILYHHDHEVDISLQKDLDDNMFLTNAVTKLKEGHREIKVVYFKDQYDLILGFFDLLASTRPNVLMAFNDSQYDWPMILDRLDHIKKTKEVEKKIKHGNQTFDEFTMKVGSLPVDVKIVGKDKLIGKTYAFVDCVCLDLFIYLKKEFEYKAGDKANISKLNHFLEDNCVPLKKDMDYGKMNKIFDNGSDEEMLKVFEYSIYDSQCLHILAEKRGVVSSLLATGNETYTNLFVNIHNADGVKIYNCYKAFCHKFGYLYTNNTNFDRTRPPKAFGGLVLASHKGALVYNKFDYHKYTPNLQEEIKMKDLSFRRKAADKNMEYIEGIQCPTLKSRLKAFLSKYPPRFEGHEWIADRPEFALDYKSLYPSVEREHNLCTTTLFNQEKKTYYIEKGIYTEEDFEKFTFNNTTYYVLRHFGKKERMGIIPVILDIFFNKRMVVQNAAKTAKAEGRLFDANVLTCKEKAIKLILNTIYGLYGDSDNRLFKSFFNFQGTCNLGRYYLLIAKILAEYHGFPVNYGDTDSIYVNAPESYFAELDEKYKNGEISILEYKEGMVSVTEKAAKTLENIINGYLKETTSFMKEAYEEIIWAVHIGSKFYFGLNTDGLPLTKFMELTKDMDRENIRKIMLSDATFLQRGVVTRKKDRSQFIKILFKEFMVQCMQPDINRSILDILCDQVKQIESNHFEKKLFVKYQIYKGNDNKAQKACLSNMEENYGITLPILTKFKTLVVKRPDGGYNLNGKRDKDNIGHKTYIYSVVKQHNLDLDMDYYITSYIKAGGGVLSYRFQNDEDDPKKAIKAATSFILKALNKKTDKRAETTYNKKLSTTYVNDKYNMGSLDFNLKLIQSQDLLSPILTQIVLDINKIYYDIAGLIITSDNQFYVSNNSKSGLLEKHIKDHDIELKKIVKPRNKFALTKLIIAQLNDIDNEINNTIIDFMNNKSKYKETMKEYYSTLDKAFNEARKTKTLDLNIKLDEEKYNITFQEIKVLYGRLSSSLKSKCIYENLKYYWENK